MGKSNNTNYKLSQTAALFWCIMITLLWLTANRTYWIYEQIHLPVFSFQDLLLNLAKTAIPMIISCSLLFTVLSRISSRKAVLWATFYFLGATPLIHQLYLDRALNLTILVQSIFVLFLLPELIPALWRKIPLYLSFSLLFYLTPISGLLLTLPLLMKLYFEYKEDLNRKKLFLSLAATALIILSLCLYGNRYKQIMVFIQTFQSLHFGLILSGMTAKTAYAFFALSTLLLLPVRHIEKKTLRLLFFVNLLIHGLLFIPYQDSLSLFTIAAWYILFFANITILFQHSVLCRKVKLSHGIGVISILIYQGYTLWKAIGS